MLKFVTNVQIRIMEQIWLNDLVWKCSEDLFKKLQHHQMLVKPLKSTPAQGIEQKMPGVVLNFQTDFLQTFQLD